MKWKYCENCYIDGHCENQDRGHECNMYAKRITDKAELLQKQLEIAIKALRGVRVWANTGNGGEQAVKKLCDITLEAIEELNK